MHAGNMNDLLYNNGTWPAAFVGAAYPHLLDQMVWEGMAAGPGAQYAGDNVSGTMCRDCMRGTKYGTWCNRQAGAH